MSEHEKLDGVEAEPLASGAAEDDFSELDAALGDEDTPAMEGQPEAASGSPAAVPLASGEAEGAEARPASAPGSQPASTPPSWSTRDPEDRVAPLARVNMFAGLTPLYLKRIAALCDEEHHPEGSFLFKEGDPGDKLYILLEGAVRITRQISGMGEEALAVLRAGDYFGEMALIDTFPRSADACVHEACRVLVMNKQKLEDLLFVDRDLAYDLLWNFVRTLSGRLRQTNDKMTFLAVTNRF